MFSSRLRLSTGIPDSDGSQGSTGLGGERTAPSAQSQGGKQQIDLLTPGPMFLLLLLVACRVYL